MQRTVCTHGIGWPTAPMTLPSVRAWRRHCLRTFPFTMKTPEEAERQLAYSREVVAIERRTLAWALKAGAGPRQVAAHRRVLDRHLAAVRNGETYFRLLEGRAA